MKIKKQALSVNYESRILAIIDTLLIGNLLISKSHECILQTQIPELKSIRAQLFIYNLPIHKFQNWFMDNN